MAARSKRWNKYLSSAGVFIAGLVLVAILDFLPVFTQLENSVYDFVCRIRPPQALAKDIVIVAIDESSMKEIGPMPWSRIVHGGLLMKLKEQGARAAVFDVLFDLPKDPEQDQAFAYAIKEFGNVVLARQLELTSDPMFAIEQPIDPLPLFYEAGATAGYVYTPIDRDNKIRKACFLVRGEPTLASEALLKFTGEKVRHEAERVFINDQEVPVATSGDRPTFLINYAGPTHTIPTRSYYQVLDGTIPPGFLQDKVVFIGLDLVAQNTGGGPEVDRFATPVDEDKLMPGVEIHANALNTLMTKAFIRTSPQTLNWSLLLMYAVLTSVYCLTLRPIGAGLATLATVFVSSIAVYYIFVSHNYWLPGIRPAALIFFVYSGNTVIQYRSVMRERAQIRNAFKSYVSAEVLGELMKNPDNLGLGGREVEATVLFTDIAGFSKISEKITPQELTQMLNQYFELLATVIMKEGGMVNKFIGDAVMALWGVPLDNPNHAVHACKASLQMHRAMLAMDPVKCRIGLNTGTMIAGNLGSKQRFEYTVIGDAVNLASRLEGVNKPYHTDIMISEMTEERVRGHFLLREVDSIRVIGKVKPVRIYQLLDTMENKGSPEHERWVEMIESFQPGSEFYKARHWEAASQAFENHARLFPEDPVGQIYLERCGRFRNAPPPEDWDGVYQMESK